MKRVGPGIFEDAPRKPRWRGSKALVPVDRETCPSCGGPMQERTMGERALFRHGGHGAERCSVTTWCSECGWSLTTEVQERKP